MLEFMSDNYLLTNNKALELYGYTKELPIFDYHCHLSPREIFEDKTFYNLTELWLISDHYKWRIMRAYGIDESYITGNAGAKEKFFKFAEALPSFIGNPVYHWAHLELKQYLGLTLPICAKNAEQIWSLTLSKMKDGSFSARKLIGSSNVKYIVTTDDPIDSLIYHQKLKKEGLSFMVLPCFRPDAAINIEKPAFTDYIKQLGLASGIVIKDF
ncbi:MAG: glucuronate isomerase, partial [Clostridia bacterium]|nr:glucuronate isomerase [Clostridia bacterium]